MIINCCKRCNALKHDLKYIPKKFPNVLYKASTSTILEFCITTETAFVKDKRKDKQKRAIPNMRAGKLMVGVKERDKQNSNSRCLCFTREKN